MAQKNVWIKMVIVEILYSIHTKVFLGFLYYWICMLWLLKWAEHKLNTFPQTIGLLILSYSLTFVGTCYHNGNKLYALLCYLFIVILLYTICSAIYILNKMEWYLAVFDTD